MNTRQLRSLFLLFRFKTGACALAWVPVLLSLFFTSSLLFPVSSAKAEQNLDSSFRTKISQYLKNGSALVVDTRGKDLFGYNPDQTMVPASILKIATADAVLSKLGAEHRIATEFYLTDNNYLAVKGYGDPTLVSEALNEIVLHLKPLLKDQLIKGIWLDSSFFKAGLKVHGQSDSSNPYDASVGALVVNFNTIYVYKSRQGKISSAEPQTPLTATARSLAQAIPFGKQRINLGDGEEQNLKYLAELLQYKLKEQGIIIPQPLTIELKPVPQSSRLIYTYYSKPVREIVKQLLYFSNNFTANQLLLILGTEQFGSPADLSKAQKALHNFLTQSIGLKNFVLQEGSGLSRNNRFSARQIIKVLQHFEPYHSLLRDYDEKFLAKTGTLKGVSTFAGYMLSPENQNIPFVIMLENPKRFDFRYQIAEQLYEFLFYK